LRFRLAWGIPPVREFPRFEYRMMDVKRAGKVIASNIWTGATEAEVRQAFKIANNFRSAHVYPMRSVRGHLIWCMRDHDLHGMTVARLKRMQAIRRKLARENFSIHLNTIQDIGGCRVIMPSIQDVRSLIDVLKERSRHELRGEDDYIQRPKDDGYRSHLLKYAYCGRDGAVIHDGRRIEVQVRSRLQHSWATAVESVGLFRGEYLKGDMGNAEWLRLFKLMSAEFAVAEECPEPPGIPPHDERVIEIRELDRSLDAIKVLDDLSHVVRWTDIAPAPNSLARPSHYLIKYNTVTREVEVHSEFGAIMAIAEYNRAESLDNLSGGSITNAVLVERRQGGELEGGVSELLR
jgi:Region found in RelA / SpoT proteins